MIDIREFTDTVLDENPEGVYVVRFEIEMHKHYINAVVFLAPDTEEPEIISEEDLPDIEQYPIAGWVDIKEINLATMTIIANSIKRRYDL